MGLQSAHDTELSALGRIHTFDDFKHTYFDAREAGFENINLDLMYGIPLQTEQSFAKTLDSVIALSPEHISAYALKIEPGTEFYRKKSELILPDEDSEYNMYKLADNKLASAGYEHYEISNYALSGRKSRHNLKYWSCDEYLGFGVAAHSFIQNVRYSNTSSIKKYISSISLHNNEYFSVEEKLSKKDISEEYIMMRLRLSDGLSEKEFAQKFGFPLDPKYTERMNPFIKSGHIKNENGVYRFTADGMYVSNYILSEILDLDT
jgi:oxygen-independent coproporphyrinogen-3 oxidase